MMVYVGRNEERKKINNSGDCKEATTPPISYMLIQLSCGNQKF